VVQMEPSLLPAGRLVRRLRPLREGASEGTYPYEVRTQGGMEVREGAVYAAAVGMQNRGRSSRARQEGRGGGDPRAGGRVGVQAHGGAEDNNLRERTAGSRSSGGANDGGIGVDEAEVDGRCVVYKFYLPYTVSV
jgi:hypothetical protein